MPKFTFDEILTVAKTGTQEEWDACLSFIKERNYQADDLEGVYEFLSSNNFNREAFIGFISSIESNEVPKKQKRHFKRYFNYIPLAAASLVLVSAIYLNYNSEKNKIHIADKALPVYMDATENLIFNKAMASYKMAKYDAAFTGFNQLNSDTSLYYAGLCLEQTLDFEQAFDYFAKIEASSIYKNKALLHQAACLIELEKYNQAQILLNDFKATDNYESDLLNQLKINLK